MLASSTHTAVNGSAQPSEPLTPPATPQAHTTQPPASVDSPSLTQTHQPQPLAQGQQSISAEVHQNTARTDKVHRGETDPAAAAQALVNDSASSDVSLSEPAEAAAVNRVSDDHEGQAAADVSHSSASSGSGRSECDSQPSTPASATSDPQAASQSSQTSLALASQVDQQVAVLSILAGAAADTASPLTHSQPSHPELSRSSAHEDQLSQADDSADQPAQPVDQSSSTADMSVAGSLSSGPASESSFDIYDALREDRGDRDDWHVVKASRKSGLSTSKAVEKSTDLVGTPDQQQLPQQQQNGASHRGRDRLAESCLRGQEGAADAVHAVNGEVAQSGKTVRRSSSGASISSWSAVEAGEAPDR